MKQRVLKYILPLFVCSVVSTYAKQDSVTSTSLQYNIELQSSFAHGNTPLWLNANKQGLSSIASQNGYIRASILKPLNNTKKWQWGYGADIVSACHYTSSFFIQQAYIEGKWKKGMLTLGSKEYGMELKNNQLSSGSQTLGINSRPIPQIRAYLPDYCTILPKIHWLKVKGHLAFGMYTDTNWQHTFTERKHNYTDHALYHSKAGYIQLGNETKHPLTIELGIEMATQFNGNIHIVNNNSTTVYNQHLSFYNIWHALVTGGKEPWEDNYQNALGNHLGSYVMRINYEKENWGMNVYADHFFEDHSGMFFITKGGYGKDGNWNSRNALNLVGYKLKDIMLGTEIKLKKCTWLNTIVLEYLHTSYQSGPLYHEHNINNTVQVSGMDDYYNHGFYPGWQHWGQVQGNPLYRSPIYNKDGQIKVTNNRFKAWHLGCMGQISPQISYKIIGTYQQSLGTYKEPYTKPEDNYYILAESVVNGKGKLTDWSIKTGIGLDFGYTLGNNKGIQITIAKKGILPHK